MHILSFSSMIRVSITNCYWATSEDEYQKTSCVNIEI